MSSSKAKRFLSKTFGFGLVGYSACSYLLFKFPHLRERPESHRRDIKGFSNEKSGVLVGAYRCGSLDALENTAPAAVKAIKSGA